MQISMSRFQIKGDERGSLIALEQNKNIPFTIRRVYYIYGAKPDSIRGKHAHRALEQVLICMNGSCEIELDDGVTKTTVKLDRRDEGLYIGPGLWREMRHFSEDAVLMAVASQLYDEQDYIRDYQAFLAWREAAGECAGRPMP